MLIEGILAAITTPFYGDGRLYLRKLEHNVDRYSHTPLSGMVVLGSTGEAVMLSDAESREVLKTAAGAAAAEKVLIAGVARESVIETLAAGGVRRRAAVRCCAGSHAPLLWAADAPGRDAELLPHDRGPVGAAGDSLQHSKVYALRDSGSGDCGACIAPQHHRAQRFEREGRRGWRRSSQRRVARASARSRSRRFSRQSRGACCRRRLPQEPANFVSAGDLGGGHIRPWRWRLPDRL